MSELVWSCAMLMGIVGVQHVNLHEHRRYKVCRKSLAGATRVIHLIALPPYHWQDTLVSYSAG